MMETREDGVRTALWLTYGLIPVVAGLDKFTNLLCDWEKYLSPLARDLLPIAPTTFMWIVGVIEVVAGAIVLSRRFTRVGAMIVGGWLLAIAVNLLAGGFYDIAVRDVAMAVGAFSLAAMWAAQPLVTTTPAYPTREPQPARA
jgi:uncharacterized membrane protein YphA (DoxX/SURF4 family)